MRYRYTLAVLGITLELEAASLTSARRQALARYVAALTMVRVLYPVLPTIILVATDDPVLVPFVEDPRAAPPAPVSPPKPPAQILSFPK